MLNYNRLRESNEKIAISILNQIDEAQDQLDKILVRTQKTAEVAKYSDRIIEQIDADFKKATKLNGVDIAFLFLATALQCARQYLLSNEKYRLTAKEGDALVATFVPKKFEDVLIQSVPYDAIMREENFQINTELSGVTHRYRTLGHDPVLGWIFGPINILSDSLTKYDLVSTYEVQNMHITNFYPNGTAGAFQNAMQQIGNNKMLLPAAVLRQAVHFGSDYFTKQGLPVPFLSTVSNDVSRTLITKCNIDMYSITRGATVAVLINYLIESMHLLFYNEAQCGTLDVYRVKTKKIIDISNVIATSSNVIYAALTRDLKKLDVGGMLVTLYRLITDAKFKYEVEKEFLSENWAKIVLGE